MKVNEGQRNLILAGIWMLITASIPFLQGGYFYVVGIGLSLLYVGLYMFLPARATVVPIYMRLYICLCLASVITLIVAVDKGMHVIYMMTLTLPISLFLSTEGLATILGWKKMRRMMGVVLILWSVGVTFPFIIGALLSVDFFIQNNRYGGFFQYANSYGAFLCGLLTYWLLPLPSFKRPSAKMRKMRFIAVVLILVAIALTQSRGIYAITVVIILIHILTDRKSFPDIAVGLVLGWGLLYVLGVENVARGTDVVTNNSEWLSRLVYYIDGLKMIRDYPLGTGHLGFYYLQGVYQTAALYHVRYIHESLLQVLLDTGIIGGLSWMAMMVYPLFIGIKDRGKRPFICGMSLVFLHTLIDFDMQFSAMWVLWYLGMVAINNHEESKRSKSFGKPWIKPAGITVSVVVLAYFTLVTGLEYMGDEDKAVLYYPGYTKAVSAVLTNQTTNRYTQEDKKDIANKAVAMNRYFYDGFAFLRKYYYNNGDLKKSIDYAQKVVELKPLQIHNLETYMAYMLEDLLNQEREGVLSKNHPYFREILDRKDYLKNLKERKDYGFTIQHEVTFEWTPRMQRIVTITQNLYDRVELE